MAWYSRAKSSLRSSTSLSRVRAGVPLVDSAVGALVFCMADSLRRGERVATAFRTEQRKCQRDLILGGEQKWPQRVHSRSINYGFLVTCGQVRVWSICQEGDT